MVVIPQEKIIQADVNNEKSIVFEGVQAGDILEYYFILKEYVKTHDVFIFQKNIPILNAKAIFTKDGLAIKLNASSLFKYTKEGNKQILEANNIPAFVEEGNSKNMKNLNKVSFFYYQYDANYVWKNKLPNMFVKHTYMSYITKKQVRLLLEKLNLSGTNEEKILKIEAYLKNNLEIAKNEGEIKSIKDLSNGKHFVTQSDLFSLYTTIFKETKIPYEGVAGMSRFVGDIDKEWYIYNFPHDFLFYFPEYKKYFSPLDSYLSYGSPIYELQDSYAMYYSPETKAFEIRKVPAMPKEYTQTFSDIQVSLSSDLAKTSAKINYKAQGYEGQLMRYTVNELQKKKENDKIKELLKLRTLFDLNAEIKDYTFKHLEVENSQKNVPVEVDLNLELKESIVENAGNLLIINLGKILGEQTNLYQEKERKTDVDLRYAKEYHYKIRFTIPDNYSIENYKDLEFDIKSNASNGQNASFVSKVKVEGSDIIVSVDEMYDSITYSLDNYNNYRNVMNASSDFTKAQLVLKRK